MHTLRAEIFLCRVYFYCEPSNQRGFSSKLKLPVAVGECLFRPCSFGDIDVDADHPLGALLAIVGNDTTPLDPPDLAVRADNAVLDMGLLQLMGKSLVAKFLHALKILRVHSGPPLAQCRLGSTLGQAVNSRITL